MLGSIYAIELFRFLNLSTLCVSTALARDPVPVDPQPGTRVAFVTTIVPSKEPVDIVRPTLEAARRIRHDGTLDVWLLDEGDDPEVRAMCAEIGVHHFSRRGVEAWNMPSGPFRAKTKHGNYNAWLDGPGGDYEFFVSVDPDHVPLPCFAERLLGYFRDPDVAFVIGPQVYGNYDNLITKCAESQQFVFHALIQRMANRFGCPMLVGTNNAIRVAAIRSIGGLQDSITEDLATSLALHSADNPDSQRRWRSVYTPDVLAVGEGPSSFSDFFTQQARWSRGTFEILSGHFWRCLRRLSPGAKLHYLLIIGYYPSAALVWLLGALNCVMALALGTTGIQAQPGVWIAVYSDLALVQLCFFAANRKHNVSPHEAEGSTGVGGMFISALAAPVFAASLIGSLTGRETKFVVTPKGASQTADGLGTFVRHIRWGLLFVAALCASFVYRSASVHAAAVVAVAAVHMRRADRHLDRHRPLDGSARPARTRSHASAPEESSYVMRRKRHEAAQESSRAPDPGAGWHRCGGRSVRRQCASGRPFRDGQAPGLADDDVLLQGPARQLVIGRRSVEDAGQRGALGSALHRQGVDHRRLGQRRR